MIKEFTFSQVDVFATGSLIGNPVAVVHSAEELTTEQMQRFAHWTNLSETTFLLPPADSQADYRLRIFTPHEEFPFAGHPTLGSAFAWLKATHSDQAQWPKKVVQECGIGLVELRVDGSTIAFKAPEFIHSGDVAASDREKIASALGLTADMIVDCQLIDNGPGWIGLVLASDEIVRGIEVDYSALGDFNVGVWGWAADRTESGFDAEVRAFVPGIGEDPVTGSLNAGFALWLGRMGQLADSTVVRQGTCVGRSGQVTIQRDGNDYWVGGKCSEIISGVLSV